jgi:hypothetical protein
MSNQSTELYLDLLKKTLSFSLWPEPALPVETFFYRRSWLVRTALGLASRVLAVGRLQLMHRRNFSTEERQTGQIWPGFADTMIGLKRLDNLQFCVETVLREGVAGDLIETGVWRGGACIFMRGILKAHDVRDRRVYVADSFAGLPEPDADAYPADRGDVHHIHEFLAISQEQVAANFRRYGLLDDRVVFLKGWFKDTLPAAPMEQLAVLRLDGDMYGSTIEALTSLYPKLSVGGYCIIDDYALPGCRKAVDDFRREQGIADELKMIDWTGAFWRKTRA